MFVPYTLASVGFIAGYILAFVGRVWYRYYFETNDNVGDGLGFCFCKFCL